jgi:ribonuclease HI
MYTQQLRHYMLTHTNKLIARIDPLKYLLRKANLTGRLAKWVMILSEFDIQHVDTKVIKGQVIADQLAEAPLLDDHPVHIEFPDADILTISTKLWELYFDGSYTQHGSGAGILFVTPTGHTIPRSYKLMLPCINNTAEYEALIIGVKMVVEWKIIELKIYGDSQLVINKFNNEYPTKDDKLMPYKRMIDDFKKYFVEIKFEQIPIINNKVVDVMATIASLLQIPDKRSRYEFMVKQVFSLVYDDLESQVISHLTEANTSPYETIYAYLRDNTLPPNLSCNQKHNLIRQAALHTIIVDVIYRRGLDGTLLRCLKSDESKKALQEVHEGICGTHSSGPTLTNKLLGLGYFWPNMEKDSYIFVKKFQKCQIHGNLIHASAKELQPFASTWPFCQWGLDLVGKIHPSSSNGHKFIITATKYFTKWVEAIPLITVTSKQISSFILNYIICHYGIPQTILTDNG